MTVPGVINSYLQNPHLPGQAFYLPSSGPDAVLLLHGLTATCAEVIGLGQVLHQAGYTVRGPLLPGHGTCPADLNRTRWQDWAAAAESAYQDLAGRYRRVFVGGESNGGLLSLYLAAHHPEIAGVLAYAAAMQLRLPAWQQTLLPLLGLFIASIPKNDAPGNPNWQGYNVNPLRAIWQLTRLQKETRPRLANIRQPVLVVQGRKDTTIDPASAEIIYYNIGSRVKELHWLEKSGHCVLLESEQEEAARLALRFMERI